MAIEGVFQNRVTSVPVETITVQSKRTSWPITAWDIFGSIAFTKGLGTSSVSAENIHVKNNKVLVGKENIKNHITINIY